MAFINSKMSLPEKLRAHAEDSIHSDVAWCMRDAANVIEAQNLTLTKLEEAYSDYLDDKSRQMGKRQK